MPRSAYYVVLEQSYSDATARLITRGPVRQTFTGTGAFFNKLGNPAKLGNHFVTCTRLYKLACVLLDVKRAGHRSEAGRDSGRGDAGSALLRNASKL